MKVLLINFASYDSSSPDLYVINRKWPPLDLLYIINLLKSEGFEAKLLDLNVQRMNFAIVSEHIKNHDVVFISSASIDRWQCPPFHLNQFLKFLTSIKEKDKIYLMGPHPTAFASEFMEKNYARGIIQGQPELTVVEILKRGCPQGLFKPREFELYNLPLPAYDQIDASRYYYALLGSPLALLEMTRGCPFNCKFCFKIMYPKKLKKKPLHQILNEIDFVVGNLKFPFVYFIDLEFAVDKELVSGLCEYILKTGYKFKWGCQTRVDTVSEDMLELMKRAGCKIIHYGIESGSQRVLNEMQKGVDLRQVCSSLKLTKKVGIETAGFFILGYPGELLTDIEATVRFAKELPLDYASFHIYLPYPEVLRVDRLTDNQRYLLRRAKRAFVEFYFRPRYVLSLIGNPRQVIRKIELFFQFIK